MSNEWIKWEGGECPVGRKVMVNVKFFSGQIYCSGDRAYSFKWNHGPDVDNIIAYRLHWQCDGCTEGDDEIPEFLKNPMKDDGITDHELDEPGDGVPEELAIEDIPAVLRPSTETITEKEDSMDDLERLARELHKWPTSECFVGDIPHLSKGLAWGVSTDVSGESEYVICFDGQDSYIHEEELKSKRDELSGKPKEWVNDWARWRGQHLSGEWYEFQCCPEPFDNGYGIDAGKYCLISTGEVLGDWRDTLEERVCISKSYESETQAYLSITDEKQPAWDGEGSPPVGTVCEYRTDPKSLPLEWDVCRYIGQTDNEDFVLRLDDDKVDRMNAIEPNRRFRPIKSDKERDIEEIDDLHEHWRQRLEIVETIGEYLYDRGYRKQES